MQFFAAWGGGPDQSAVLAESAPASPLSRMMRGGRGQPLLIVILAWNRPESLRRLLDSLERADYGAAPASMEVRFALDATGNTTMDSEMDAVIDALRWPHGDVFVRRRTARAGLRENILGSWTGAEGRPGVMLEDDIEVSALWWHWAQAGLKRYAHLPAVVGVSLFTPGMRHRDRTPA